MRCSLNGGTIAASAWQRGPHFQFDHQSGQAGHGPICPAGHMVAAACDGPEPTSRPVRAAKVGSSLHSRRHRNVASRCAWVHSGAVPVPASGLRRKGDAGDGHFPHFLEGPVVTGRYATHPFPRHLTLSRRLRAIAGFPFAPQLARRIYCAAAARCDATRNERISDEKNRFQLAAGYQRARCNGPGSGSSSSVA